MMALICDPNIPLRVEAIEAMRGFPGPGLIRFIDFGVVNWAPNGRRQPVLIFDLPGGNRVFETMDSVIQPLSDDQLINGFLTPAANTLRELSSRGITHRNIRPSNLYYTDASARMILIGECLSAPAGYNQPVHFETLECGMADETGRGSGSPSDDIFALGVTLLSLLIGKNPVPNVADVQKYLIGRINLGSYANLVGTYRIQMNMTELLRGLLTDDVTERWPLSELQLWLGGRRLTPKQVKLPAKAARPLTVGGLDHENVRSAAHGLGRNWIDGGDIVRSQDFDTWIRRSLIDERVLENMNRAVGAAQAIQASPKSEDSRLVTKVAMALDPSAPIRHQGLSTHIDGIGVTLAMGFFDDKIRGQIADMVNGGFLRHWMSLQARTRSEIMNIIATIEKLQGMISQTGPGYGIERCLYELNPFVHCMSSMIDHLYITKPEELIPALESIAHSTELPPVPIDRHIAAFLAARSPEIDDRILRPLTQRDDRPAADAIKILRILARVQALHGNDPAPGLCSWLKVLSKPAVDAFYNLKIRRQVQDSVNQASDTGQLIALQRIFDDANAIQKDQQGYLRAQEEYTHCSATIDRMNFSLGQKENLAGEMGEQVAAVISGVIGSIGATSAIIFYVI